MAVVGGYCHEMAAMIEYMYYNYCRKDLGNDLMQTLIHIAWQWRQSFFSSYVDANLNVHVAHKFLEVTGSRFGLKASSLSDFEARDVEITEPIIHNFAIYLDHMYPIYFIKAIHEQLTLPISSSLKIGDGTELFPHLFFDEMQKKECLPRETMSLLEERFRMMKEEARHNWAFWDQRLFYVSDVEEILSIDHLEGLLFLKEPQNPVLVKALKWALFYPLCQEIVKPEDLCRFFVSLGWFKEMSMQD